MAYQVPAPFINRNVQTFAAPSFVQTTLTTTAGSTSATVASGSGITNGMYVSCVNVPAGTTITISGTAVTLSSAAITSATNAPAFFADLQTWTKPANSRLVRIRLWGGGGGGAGGCTNATSTIRPGGAGGGAGGVLDKWISADALGSTVAIAVGHGGLNGTGATTNNAAGVAGYTGGPTIFGTVAVARGGGGGSTTLGGASPSSSAGGGVQGGNVGGATSAGTSSSGVPANIQATSTENGSGGGGSGGGWTALNVTSAGGSGGFFLPSNPQITGHSGGSTSYNGASAGAGTGTGLLTTGAPVGSSGGAGGATVGQSRQNGSMSSGSNTLTFTGSVTGLTAGSSGTIVHNSSAGFPAGVVRVASIVSNTGSGTCTVTLSANATGTVSGTVYFAIAGTTHNGAAGGTPGGGGGGGGAGVSDPVTTSVNSTSGQNTITVASNFGIYIGSSITNASMFPSGATVTNIAGTTITTSVNASATITGGATVFSFVQCNGGDGGSGGAGAAIIETYW